MAKILLVEDDPLISQSLIDWLEAEHHTVELAEDGKEAQDLLKFYQYDLVILDWQLPGISGIEVCRNFRSAGGQIPILMLTSQGNIEHKELGLDSGADDYLTKPFQLREVGARIRALLRRPFDMLKSIGTANTEIQLEPKDYSVVFKSSKKVALQPKEYAVLEFLMRHPEQFFTTEQLLNQVWKSDSDSTTGALRACIKRLRKRLSDDCPGLIESARNSGYRVRIGPEIWNAQNSEDDD
ncbi:MAG: response regulator transcription factor [Candidatus Obscuribacterales bacterium]|nr:response regulator transcription factor [Candidatus Obscuribacterales bacterium]